MMLKDLCASATTELYLPGEMIFHRGEIGTNMYLIRKGYVNVCDGSELYLF